MKNKRLSVDEYFMMMAYITSARSTCIRHKVGSVITKDDKIVSTGYNGAVRGEEHCIDKTCIRDDLNIKSGTKIEICHAVHAEQNALLQAGKNAENGTLYCNVKPCITCSKMIINAGIKRVVIPYNDDYPDFKGIELLEKMNVEVVILKHMNITDLILEIL